MNLFVVIYCFVFFLSLFFSLGTNKLIVNQLVHIYKNKEKP